MCHTKSNSYLPPEVPILLSCSVARNILHKLPQFFHRDWTACTSGPPPPSFHLMFVHSGRINESANKHFSRQRCFLDQFIFSNETQLCVWEQNNSHFLNIHAGFCFVITESSGLFTDLKWKKDFDAENDFFFTRLLAYINHYRNMQIRIYYD